MSRCATFQSTLLWRKSKTMEMIEKGEHLLPMKNSKTDQDGTGIHIGMPVYETKNLEYVQGISIGMPGQEFLVWINLQHYDLIVPSTNCTTIDCGRMKKFDPYGSDFFKASTNYSEVYLSNFEAVGYYGTDFVTFNHSASLSVNNMRFLLAHHLESTAAVKSGFDGVLGLQPSLLHNSFIDSLIENGYLDKPFLTIWLSSRNVPPEVPAGTITYGAIDEAHCSTETILYTQTHIAYLIEVGAKHRYF
ncbi:hypothetical protein OESDEN_24887 [Oesophagostomum dentatum]|uniref:Peptidase A1 domain-containing protein n=1 Tax=Oesophagostomum dentatum TaxID=61180 RepID=A0A0B1RWE9_OESDE|nr:hypothetical protein OESDEN_24887 [Oesophagostomum dentatum]